MAERGARLGARVLDAVAELALVIGALIVLAEGDRPFAGVAIAWFVVALYEAGFVAALGATPGKLLVGLRVTGIDVAGRIPLAQAAKRAATTAALSVTVVIGWIPWLSSTLTDALGRGIADRAADTMVVPKAAVLPIVAQDLPGYADGARAPRLSPLGRVGDLDVRVRARLRRLRDAPVLVGAIGLLAIGVSLPVSDWALVLATSLVWVVVFVADETWRIAHRGATAGHDLAGLVVLDHRTGAPPGGGRAFARALVLGLTTYVFLLWPLLVISMIMIRFGGTGRGLHDLAGGTLVVADPRLDPEAQRQAAMRMRIGRAA